MQRTEPPHCVVCQDARTLLAAEGEHGQAAVLARYDDPTGGPPHVLIACPACADGQAAPTDYFAALNPYGHQAAAAAAARAVALAPTPAGWLIFTGGYGSGKTTIAGATARTLRSRGVPVRVFTASALKDAMYAGFRSGEYSGWLASLKRARCLYIDELDSVDWDNPNVEELFSELLNARYSTAGSTLTILVAADLSPIHPRVVSRMRQFRPLDLGPIDLRVPSDPYAGAWDRGEAAA